MEFIPKRSRSTIYTFANTLSKLVVLAIVIYFRFVSRSWELWFQMIFVVQLFVIAGQIWLPESPDFYFAKGRYEESKCVIL